MFGGYQFGDISKSIYNKASGDNTNNKQNNNQKKQKKSTKQNPSSKTSGYKFGDVTKSIYNKASGVNTNNKQNKDQKKQKESTKQNAPSTASGYKFGDVTKSIYNKVSNINTDLVYQYHFGDVTKSAYYSVAAHNVKISNESLEIEGFLKKKSPFTLTYRFFWVVLQNKKLYLFKTGQERKHSLCLYIIDLLLYDTIQSVQNGLQGEFRLISKQKNGDDLAFISPDSFKTKTWIKYIMNAIDAHKIEMISNELLSNQSNSNPQDLDLGIIAYYIIELEYNHSESGDVETMLLNQNFIISSIIWSFMHQKDKKFDWKVNESLTDYQKKGLKYWQQPMAITHGVVGGLEGALQGPAAAQEAWYMVRLIFLGPFCGNKMDVILPLSVVAALGYGTYATGHGVYSGFVDSYNETK